MDEIIENIETPPRKTFVSMEQKRLIVEFIKKNPMLASGKFGQNFTQKDSQQLWQKLTMILNSSPGANKDWKSWRKTWQDIRSRTKVKYSKYNRERNATGGGLFDADPITPYETEILDTIKSVSVEGHTNIKESCVEFSFEVTEPSHAENSNEDIINNNNSLNSKIHEISSEAVYDPNTVKFQSANLENRAENTLTEVTNTRNFECNISNLPKNTKTTSRAPRKKFTNAFQASESYRRSLEHKNKIKEEYYKQKIMLLERLTIAKERSAVAQEKIADNIEKLVVLGEEFL